MEAVSRGHEVIFITGESPYIPEGALVEKVVSAGEMMEKVKKHFNKADIIIGAAAVGDFTVEKKAGKIKRIPGGGMSLNLTPTEDIIGWAGNRKGKKKVIGFAAESGDLKHEAVRKLKSKKLDMIVFNDVSKKDSGFSSDNNEITVISGSGRILYSGSGPKKNLAAVIINLIENGAKK
jgi:phosphopantothenoylcysteine decarboxylase/phosphopantothenate--cysteine ligase